MAVRNGAACSMLHAPFIACLLFSRILTLAHTTPHNKIYGMKKVSHMLYFSSPKRASCLKHQRLCVSLPSTRSHEYFKAWWHCNASKVSNYVLVGNGFCAGPDINRALPYWIDNCACHIARIEGRERVKRFGVGCDPGRRGKEGAIRV